MGTHRELTLDDYFNILKRRLWWLLIPAIVAPLVALGISLKLPNRYTSQTLVLVEQQKVPDVFVKPVVTEDLSERLATMQEQILSRTRLQPIIERFGLFKDQSAMSMEEKVEKMRGQVTVEPVRADFGSRTGGLPGFYISFTAQNPRLAQQVCTEITSMFMQENLRVREQRAQGTTEFLKKQLEDAKRELDQQDARLAAFKRNYIGQLPGQEQANFNMLASQTAQLSAITQALSRLQQEKTYNDSMLVQQVASWKSLKAGDSPETLEEQLAKAEAELVSLEARYTNTHPDVIKMKNDIELLKKRIDEKHSNPAAANLDKEVKPGIEPPQVQQLRAQQRALEQAIADKTREQAQLQQQIRTYEGRIQLSPIVEEQYKALTRDYQTALNFYNELLNKKNQSEMATDLEKRQQGEQFRIMDPANLPEKPTFPNRPLFAGGGLAVGLVFGITMVFFLEMRDKSLRTERDVQFYLELPTLAMMPLVGVMNGNGHGGSGRHFWKASPAKARSGRHAVGA